MKHIGLEILCGDEPLDRLERLVESLPPAAEFADVVVGVGTDGGPTAERIGRWWLDWGARVALCVGPVDDFAAARNQVHEVLQSDWALWIDADDQLIGSGYLRRLDERLDRRGDLVALVAPYEYRHDESGRSTCLIERERLVRVDATHWEGAVGETLEWTDGRHERTDLLRVVHERQTPQEMRAKSERNFVIARTRQDHSVRMRWMLARSSADIGHYSTAISAFENLAQDRRVPDSIRYQSACEAARCALRQQADERKLDQVLDDAGRLVRLAFRLMPRLGEAYFLAARIAYLAGDPTKACYWLDRGWSAATPGRDWPAPWDPTAYTTEPQRLLEEIEKCRTLKLSS